MMFTPAKKTGAGSNVFPVMDPEHQYVLPAEDDEQARHEGTWLQWPHNYGWDPYHAERYDAIWIAMTHALHTGERVHIIVFNETEQERVTELLTQAKVVDLKQVDFNIMATDDVWIRDNGPIFVRNRSNNNELLITDWRFNGWGNKQDYWWSNGVPDKIAQQLRRDDGGGGGTRKIKCHAIPMVLEGGAIEVDGRGTLLAKLSCILNDNRNPGWTITDVEAYFRRYLGATNFIWLPGNTAHCREITDDHIDGTARFAHGDTIVTTHKSDFENPREYDILTQAIDVNGNPYKIVHLPLTRHKIRAVNDYGTYVNYYVGNDVVLVPAFGDPLDSQAASILQGVYPSRKVVSINVEELYKDGGMIHCVTMQQPAE